jgi:hypothetical protein
VPAASPPLAAATAEAGLTKPKISAADFVIAAYLRNFLPDPRFLNLEDEQQAVPRKRRHRRARKKTVILEAVQALWGPTGVPNDVSTADALIKIDRWLGKKYPALEIQNDWIEEVIGRKKRKRK